VAAAATKLVLVLGALNYFSLLNDNLRHHSIVGLDVCDMM
jgi:hypothetical protein